MKKDQGTPVVRVVKLDETSWKWLCDWLSELLKQISLDEMNEDSLRMGGILTDVKAATRESNERGSVSEL